MAFRDYFGKNDPNGERIAKALENIATLLQTDLASRGILVAFDTSPEDEGEAWLTDLDTLGEIEAKKEKYEQEVGIRPVEIGRVGPLAPDGTEWPPDVPIEKLEEQERAIGRSTAGFSGIGPENAESDSETFEGGGGEEGPPSGHIPR